MGALKLNCPQPLTIVSNSVLRQPIEAMSLTYVDLGKLSYQCSSFSHLTVSHVMGRSSLRGNTGNHTDLLDMEQLDMLMLPSSMLRK